MNVTSAAYTRPWPQEALGDSTAGTAPYHRHSEAGALYRRRWQQLALGTLGELLGTVERALSESARSTEGEVSQWASTLGEVWRLPDIVQVATMSSASMAVEWPEHIVRWLEGAHTTARPFEALEGSALQMAQCSPAGTRLDILLRLGAEQTFEDGMHTEFSREFIRLVETYGTDAVVALGARIVGGTADPEVVAEALRCLGRMDAPTAKPERLHLLENSLSSSSRWIRDGASLGLAAMDDPHAIPYLGQAIERETVADLRKDLELVLTQLENTRLCRSS